jgi:hypothetical protein
MKKPHILFKFPTRNRPERFFRSLDSIINNLADLENFEIQVTADADDPTMANQDVFQLIQRYPNTHILYGLSKSKVYAVNRDMAFFNRWDVVCCHSDDMKWQFYGFDEIIRQEFADGDFDKLLHVPDTDAKQALATYYIAGRDYYNRFGYIYHESYSSLWCDNEVQDVAKQLGKYKLVDCPGMLFHEHPSYNHIPFDAQYRQQQGFWDADEANYRHRKQNNFFL